MGACTGYCLVVSGVDTFVLFAHELVLYGITRSLQYFAQLPCLWMGGIILWKEYLFIKGFFCAAIYPGVFGILMTIIEKQLYIITLALSVVLLIQSFFFLCRKRTRIWQCRKVM